MKMRFRVICAAAVAVLLPAAIVTAQMPPINPAAFVQSQEPGQWHVSRLQYSHVIGRNGERVGTLNDFLVDKNGNVVVYVIGVSSFMQMGIKCVGVRPSDAMLTVNNPEDPSKWLLLVGATSDEMKNAPALRSGC